MNVGQICTREAITVSPTATLNEIAQLMYDRHVGAVIVTTVPMDRPVVIGMITDRDVVRAQLSQAAALSQLRAEAIMTGDPLVLNEQQPIIDALRRLHERGVRRAPIIDNSGALVGLISTDDLLGEISEQLLNLASIVGQQPRQESRQDR